MSRLPATAERKQTRRLWPIAPRAPALRSPPLQVPFLCSGNTHCSLLDLSFKHPLLRYRCWSCPLESCPFRQQRPSRCSCVSRWSRVSLAPCSPRRIRRGTRIINMAADDADDQYFVYEARLASFHGPQLVSKRRVSTANSRAPKTLSWPHKTPGPLAVCFLIP